MSPPRNRLPGSSTRPDLGKTARKCPSPAATSSIPTKFCAEYGADAFRLYEMFMGPLEMVKPWNTKGVEGVYRFFGRVWRLYVDEQSETEFEQTQAAEGAEMPARWTRLNSAPRFKTSPPRPPSSRHSHLYQKSHRRP